MVFVANEPPASTMHGALRRGTLLGAPAPNTRTHQERRMRHPGLAPHTRNPRAEGWWQVQETPRGPGPPPRSLEGPNPSVGPQLNPTNTRHISQTTPAAAIGSKHPKSHLPQPSPICPGGSKAAHPKPAVPSPSSPPTLGTDSSLRCQNPSNASNKTGRSTLKLISLYRSYAMFNNI